MQSFTVGDYTFSQVPSIGKHRVWRCEAAGIDICERQFDRMPLSKCIAERGAETLSRRGDPRKFSDPQTAAKVALTEWR